MIKHNIDLSSVIIDIDGTVLSGDREINHSLEFLYHLEKSCSNYLLATNSIKSHDVQVERFKRIGFPLQNKRVYTPIDTINTYIKCENISNVLVVGSQAEIDQIRADHNGNNPELIILLDFEKQNKSYNDLQQIIFQIEQGCPVISASGSPFYLKSGRKQIDTGAFVTLIESITGKKIPILGKPSRDYFLNAKSKLESDDNTVTVIGDDWSTDIQGANAVGFNSVLIRSGKYKIGDDKKGQAHLVIDNFLDLMVR